LASDYLSNHGRGLFSGTVFGREGVSAGAVDAIFPAFQSAANNWKLSFDE
jgi:hypothetical protein